MTLAVYMPDAQALSQWCEGLRALLPEHEVLPWGDADPARVTYAAAWQPPRGDLARLPELRAIISLAAGIDHLLADPDLPREIPILRTIGTDLTQRMKEYVALHVLRHHRDMPSIAAAQRRHDWNQITVPPATARRVGVMGLGNLGAGAAQLLAQIGFQTVGWSRSQKQVAGVTCYNGAEGFAEFLAGTEILVCLLPLTPETEGILNRQTFAQLVPGASLVNAARGGHMVEGDLLAALASGQIAQATLDVFQIEPLPQDHPFWDHPGVTVTPHIASMIDVPTGIKIVAQMIRAFEAGEDVPSRADARRGY